ncbi:MAG: hypothetical protein AAB622_02740 [Patescibacteria group bacterium]
MADLDLSNITFQELNELLENGTITMVREVGTSWSLKAGEKTVGMVNADTLLGEAVVSVGGRELGRFDPNER